ncbi:MAG: 3-phosphoshikimate 1-carboxyvinyltransferase [Actinomycetota bacterium]|nr:3-phosphoshikimate 1-carboxyvinyltransferase [Actinomycetota bacterium]
MRARFEPSRDPADGREARRRFEPSGPLRGSLRPPPDKSVSHRAALLAAMVAGPVVIRDLLDAADTRSTLAAVHALGARIEGSFDELVVRGVGLRGAGHEGGGLIDVGNAGTLMRLLPGWLAGQPGGEWTLDGDDSIRRRPVDRVVSPLRAMGAAVQARDGRLPPLTVRGSSLRGAEHRLPVASAQVKSCLLLAGLLAEGYTAVTEPDHSRDHTERMLARAGVSIERDGTTTRVAPVEDLGLDEVAVPGDPSSAAFAVAAACVVPGSRVVVEGVGLNWTRTGFLRIARRMGAAIAGDLEPPPALDGALPEDEPVGGLEIEHAALRGTETGPEEVPLAIDELPLVALLACFAEGETVVRGAEELRVKESDRIAGVVEGLRGLGADIEATEDGFAVRGGGGLAGGVLDARGDHRLAMLGAVAGLASRSGVEVLGMDAAAVSYPAFEGDLRRLLAG